MVENADTQRRHPSIIDEAIKDRTVRRIALMTVIAVGLLGLWVIRPNGLPWVSQSAPLQVSPTSTAALPPKTTPADRQILPPIRPIASAITGAEKIGDQQAEVVTVTGAAPAVPGAPDALAVQPTAAAPVEIAPDTTEVFVSQLLIPAKKARDTQHFGVQLGVFNTVANAEKLRQKMQAQGVPVVVEARVHVGPFATRAEADSARARLKALGIADSVLVILK